VIGTTMGPTFDIRTAEQRRHDYELAATHHRLLRRLRRDSAR
jgi:hypothetical protein